MASKSRLQKIQEFIASKVLEMRRELRPITASRITREIGITRQSVYRILKSLIVA